MCCSPGLCYRKGCFSPNFLQGRGAGRPRPQREGREGLREPKAEVLHPNGDQGGDGVST